jgi:hypothetical protein
VTDAHPKSASPIQDHAEPKGFGKQMGEGDAKNSHGKHGLFGPREKQTHLWVSTAERSQCKQILVRTIGSSFSLPTWSGTFPQLPFFIQLNVREFRFSSFFGSSLPYKGSRVLESLD